MWHAVASGLHLGGVSARYMQPVHYDIAGTHASNGLGQLCGNAFAVDVNHQGRFFRIIQALAYANAEEGGVLLYKVAAYKLFEISSLVEQRRLQGGGSGESHALRCRSHGHSAGVG